LRLGGSLLVLVSLASSMALPARADRLDDDLDTVWESVWDERGSPRRLIRWEQPLRYRFSGAEGARHHPDVVAALTAVAQAAGVTLSEAVEGATGEAEANLDIEFVSEQALGNGVGCVTQPSYRDWALTKVRLRVRPSQAWGCAHHEAMHVMGVPGHPSGKTVLSYFPWRRDTLMDMDRLLLATWYDRSVPRGATPLDVLLAGGRRVTAQPDLGVTTSVAEQRRQAHFDARVREMEAFARGEGDVPMIVKRSGRANAGHIEEARLVMAYYLGLAHRRAAGMPRDAAAAVAWFTRAASAGHAPSQVLLARALIRGEGVPADPVQAHRWLDSASRAGNGVARKELDDLERDMDPALLEKARGLAPK
jgi:hypothetical protein